MELLLTKGRYFVPILHSNTFCIWRQVKTNGYEDIGFVSVLKSMGMSDLVIKFKGCHPILAYKFHSKLRKDIAIFASLWFEKVYVRGEVFEFSSTLISEHLRRHKYGLKSVH